ncbi:Respiratory burst oxidase like protein E [Apostasia shenzhenica]|uniref:Respiratory burst oxidase like protein E n=1 Tax=Apostasia shenzhenica TaxID=1088818 RepID=A0A2I0A979_9ASPA|nr:Respiratory burst oxidase like protein E [Apostasia shenzhenica]
MRTPSFEGSSSRNCGHKRIADYLEDCQDSDDEGYGCNGLGGSGMLPVFLSDQSELVEVMLEMDEESIAVRSITPIAGGGERSLSRSSSLASQIRRKLGLRRSRSQRSSSISSLLGGAVEEDAPPNLVARDVRRRLAQIERTRSGAQRALKGLRFISHTTGCGSNDAAELWGVVEERFAALAVDGLLSREDFGECIGMADSKEFAGRLFDALARRRRQSLEMITKEELKDFWLQISDQSFDARLQIFFDIVDTNADGRITREEVQELIVLSASANKLSKFKEQAEEYAALIMEELDPENLGYIELWQLEALLLQRDSHMTCSRPLSTASGGGGLVGWAAAIGIGRIVWAGRAWKAARVFVRDGWRRAWVVALWMMAMAALFSWKFVEYRRLPAFRVMGYCLPTAKGAAETLKLNMALVLLPVCRNTLTWLRSTRARLFVPFDDNINFHKMIAAAIVVAIVVHAGNHLACDFPRLTRESPAGYQILLAEDFGAAKPSYGKLVLGVEGVTGIAMVVLMAVSFTLATHSFRKNVVRLPYPLNLLTGFNAFWYSHHLLAVVYALLLVHGYFLFLVHNWYRKTVSLLPGNVLTVIMSKPQGFRYRSGQYIFLQCPTISPFEWHPFSITSAPGDSYLSVHIRTNGDWTQELKRMFLEKYFSNSSPKTAKLGELLASSDQKSLPKLLVDGPYGAPAQNFRNYDVLLLDLTTETSRSDDSLNSLTSSSSSSKKRPHRTTHAHFYWVTREAGSFEWFKGVMNEVAEMDKKGVIELHNYLTSVYEEGDARTTLLAMVQALNHAKHGFDIVSGTQVKTHFSRPNWTEVFRKIAAKHKGATVGKKSWCVLLRHPGVSQRTQEIIARDEPQYLDTVPLPQRILLATVALI